MTTLRDILMDLAQDIRENTELDEATKRDDENIVDEYIEYLKERLIG